MSRKRFSAVFTIVLAVVIVLELTSRAQGQDGRKAYQSMAPLYQYLIADRDAEITLARSAAPEAISRDAKILILGPRRYETAVEGRNGFVCVVERSWMSPFDSTEFWNPKLRGAICYNPPAVRSVLPITYKRTEMALAGLSKAQMIERIKIAYAKKEFPLVEPGAMSYMMSKQAYLTDDDHHNLAHLMFYTPPMDSGNWGADLRNSPVILGAQGGPEPFTLFIVPVGKWSDGTRAPLPK